MTDDASVNENSSSTARGPSGCPTVARSDGLEPHLDTVNRLERNLDEQIATLREINDQAEHVTRLLAILLGVFVSALSIGVRYRWFGDVHSPPSGEALLLFVLGVGALLFSMGAAIITYLRSRYRIGLQATAGRLLKDPEYDAEMGRHIRRVLGTYAYNIERNTAIIEANSRRFRWSLLSLLVGILWIIVAVALFVGAIDGVAAGVVALIAVLGASAVSWYVLSDRYLT